MLFVPSWTMPAATQGRLIGRVMLVYTGCGVVLALQLIDRHPAHTAELGMPGRAPASVFLIALVLGSLLAGRQLSHLYWQRVSRMLLSAREMPIMPAAEYGATGRTLGLLLLIVGVGMVAAIRADSLTDLVLATVVIAAAAMVNLTVATDLHAWERRHHVRCYCLRDGAGAWRLVKAQRQL